MGYSTILIIVRHIERWHNRYIYRVTAALASLDFANAVAAVQQSIGLFF